MHRKRIIKALAALAFIVSFAACGGGGSNIGGGVAEFKTVRATALASTTRLEADLINGNTCTGSTSSGGNFVTEIIDFAISTTAVTSTTAGVTSTPLPVSVRGYTVSYTPKNTGTPALAPITSSYGPVIIAPGGSQTISVPVITDLQKSNIVQADLSFPCSATYYQYDVTVSFIGVEIGSNGSSQNIDGTTLLALADRNNL